MKPKIILTASGTLSILALLALSFAAPSESEIERRNSQLKVAQGTANGASETKSPTGTPDTLVGPFQSEVALVDKQWNTIPSSDTKLSQAIEASDLTRGRGLVNQHGAFQGTVSSIYISPSNSITVLNFGARRGEALMAVVYPQNYSKFPDLAGLQGKKVLVEGQFIVYRNGSKEELVEIILTDLNQISIVR
jgi:hypothetical protein